MKRILKLAVGAVTGGAIGGGSAVAAEAHDLDSAIIALIAAIGGVFVAWRREQK